MPEFSLKVPFTLVLLSAALWTFAIAYWRPTWLHQNRIKRVFTTALEGLVCTGIWSAVLLLGERLSTGTALINGCLAGLAWTITAFYSRSRYKTTLQQSLDSEEG